MNMALDHPGKPLRPGLSHAIGRQFGLLRLLLWTAVLGWFLTHNSSLVGLPPPQNTPSTDADTRQAGCEQPKPPSQEAVPATLAPPPAQPATPKPVEQVPVETPPRPSAASGGAAGGSSVAEGARIDAAYEQPVQVLDWLLSRGARVLLTDNRYAPVAEVLPGRVIRPPTPPFPTGTLRSANREVRALLGSAYPREAAHAVIHWPDHVWQQVLNAIDPSAQHAELLYRVRSGILEVEIRRLRDRDGLESGAGRRFQIQ